jgi:hypothetical protein
MSTIATGGGERQGRMGGDYYPARLTSLFIFVYKFPMRKTIIESSYVGYHLEFAESADKTRGLIDRLFFVFTISCVIAAFVHFQDFFKKILDLDSSVVLQFSLYFLAWLWLYGTKNDTYIQQDIMLFASKRPKLTATAIAFCVGVCVLFVSMAFSVGNYKWFSWEFLMLQSLNVPAYYYLVKIFYGKEVDETLESAKESCAPDKYPYLFVRIKAGHSYLFGKWQFIRLFFSVFYCSSMVAFSYATDVVPVLQIPTDKFIAYAFVLHIIIFEGWIYYMRLKLHFAQKNAKKYCGTRCCVLGQ